MPAENFTNITIKKEARELIEKYSEKNGLKSPALILEIAKRLDPNVDFQSLMIAIELSPEISLKHKIRLNVLKSMMKKICEAAINLEAVGATFGALVKNNERNNLFNLPKEYFEPIIKDPHSISINVDQLENEFNQEVNKKVSSIFKKTSKDAQEIFDLLNPIMEDVFDKEDLRTKTVEAYIPFLIKREIKFITIFKENISVLKSSINQLKELFNDDVEIMRMISFLDPLIQSLSEEQFTITATSRDFTLSLDISNSLELIHHSWGK